MVQKELGRRESPERNFAHLVFANSELRVAVRRGSEAPPVYRAYAPRGGDIFLSTSNPDSLATVTKLGTHFIGEGSVPSEEFQSRSDEMGRKDYKRSEHAGQVSPSSVRTPDAPDLCQESVRR